MDDFAHLINDQFKQLKEAVRKRGRVNILIAGKTGVGKSTLINAIFQGDFATTGQGKPITKHTRQIKKSGIPLRIFDTRGLELDRLGKSLEELENLILKLRRSRDGNKHIHCAWFCLSEDSRRVEDGELALLKTLARHVPVLILITKARADGGFEAKVRQLMPEASNVLRVRAIGERYDDGHTLPAMNLPEVVEWTMRAIPEKQRNAFAAAQKVALDLKRERAHLIVASAATAAVAVGAAPIPFADAYLLIPIQATMLASITSVFGLQVNIGFQATLFTAILGAVGGTLLGRSVVQNLLLLIPGAGVILRGMLSGATAAVFTTALGEAHITALSCFISANPGRVPTGQEIATGLKAEMARTNPFGRKKSKETNVEPAELKLKKAPRDAANVIRPRVGRFSSGRSHRDLRLAS
jgi:uncharacterized protein (DUF697 family)/GTPase SAR1 family protein